MPRTDSNPFPDETPVQVRYPLTSEQEHSDREAWPWLPGSILQRCGPDEWSVAVAVPELETVDGFPVCFRDSTELRADR